MYVYITLLFCHSLDLPFSPTLETVVCPTIIVLNEVKKSNLFSVCSVFSCCKNGSDNFQVLLDRANTISLTFAFKTFVLIMDLCICTGS